MVRTGYSVASIRALQTILWPWHSYYVHTRYQVPALCCQVPDTWYVGILQSLLILSCCTPVIQQDKTSPTLNTFYSVLLQSVEGHGNSCAFLELTILHADQLQLLLHATIIFNTAGFSHRHRCTPIYLAVHRSYQVPGIEPLRPRFTSLRVTRSENHQQQRNHLPDGHAMLYCPDQRARAAVSIAPLTISFLRPGAWVDSEPSPQGYRLSLDSVKYSQIVKLSNCSILRLRRIF